MTLLSVASNVGIWIDIAIIAVLVIFAFIGFKNGFFKSVLSMLSTLVIIVITFISASPVAKLVNKIYDFTGLIAGKLCKGIASMGAFYNQTIPSGRSGADLAQDIPSNTNGFLKNLMEYVLKPMSASDIQGQTVAEVISGAFASIIFTVIIGILLFILIKIVVSLASRLFENIVKIKVLGFANKMFGLAFGAIKGLLIIAVFSLVLTFLTVIPAVNNKISPIIQDHTKIARPVYNYTDELVEKYVIDSNIIQKWINNLWENKKSGNTDPEPEVDNKGSLTNPNNITLSNNDGILSSNFSAVFDNNEEVCYIFSPSQITQSTFSLVISSSGVTYTLYASDDTSTVINDYTALDRTKNYIIQFTRENNLLSAVDVIITLTGNVE